MTNYKISIIIPVYNVESYIEDCLKSVANQTMTNGVECIIVDDCGKDNSIRLAERFCRGYKGNIKFSIVRREKNGGLSAARNSGICHANGTYLFFLDSDDTIVPNCLKLMYSRIVEHRDVELVQGSYYDEKCPQETPNKYKIPNYTSNRKIIKSFLLTYAGDIVCAQHRLILKSFLIKNNLYFKEGIIHEDNYWSFFLAKYVSSMAFCSERTYYHRYNPNSITGQINISKEIQAYKTIIEATCSNIDSFLPGRQKELILYTLLTALNNKYYENEEDKIFLIKQFVMQNKCIEKHLFHLYLKIKNNYLKIKILHILIRLYKLDDKIVNRYNK